MFSDAYVPGCDSDLYDDPNEDAQLYEETDGLDDYTMNGPNEYADEIVCMDAYLGQGHTIEEWLLLKDDLDAYITFLELLLKE